MLASRSLVTMVWLTGCVNMSAPLVSIIVPTFNRAKYLQEAIQSIQQQSFQGWELVVIDDGSVDDTATILDRLCSIDPRINYRKQENRGSGAARNHGLSIAQGSYVAFLDSDDRYLPLGLETLVQAITAGHRRLIYGDYVVFDEADGTTKPIRASAPLARPRLALQFLIPRANPILPSATIVERRALEEIGGFDETFRTGQAVELWSRFTRRHDIHRLGKQVTVYRRHPGQVTRDLVQRRLDYDRIGLKTLNSIDPAEWFPAESPIKTAQGLDDLYRLLMGGKFALVDTALRILQRAQQLAPSQGRMKTIDALERNADALLEKRYGTALRAL